MGRRLETLKRWAEEARLKAAGRAVPNAWMASYAEDIPVLVAVVEAADDYILALRQIVYAADPVVRTAALSVADGLGERYRVAADTLTGEREDGFLTDDEVELRQDRLETIKAEIKRLDAAYELLPESTPYESLVLCCLGISLAEASVQEMERLMEALGGLLEGLDANTTEECLGISDQAWEQRIERARAALGGGES